MAEELKRHGITFSLDLNKHPKDSINLSLINAENFKISEDGASLVSDKSLKENETIKNKLDEYYGEQEYKIIHCITANDEIVLFIASNYIEDTYYDLDLFRYSEKFETCSGSIIPSEYEKMKYYGGKFSGTFTYNVKNELIIAFCEYDSVLQTEFDYGEPMKIINLGYWKNNELIFERINLDPRTFPICPEVSIPKMANENIIDGYSKKGWYHFYIRYKIDEHNYTQWYNFGKSIYLDEFKEQIIFDYKSHECPNGIKSELNFSDELDIVNKTITFNLENIDFKYKYYQIGCICNTKTYSNAKISSDLLSFNDVFVLNYSDLKDYDSLNFIKQYNNLYNVKNIINYNNRLYISNYNINYFKDDIKFRFNINSTSIDINTDYEYKIKNYNNKDIIIKEGDSYLNYYLNTNVCKYKTNKIYKVGDEITDINDLIDDVKYFAIFDGNVKIGNYYIKEDLLNIWNECIVYEMRYINTIEENKFKKINNVLTLDLEEGKYFIINDNSVSVFEGNNKFDNEIDGHVLQNNIFIPIEFEIEDTYPHLRQLLDINKNNSLIPNQPYNFYYHKVNKYGEISNGFKLNILNNIISIANPLTDISNILEYDINYFNPEFIVGYATPTPINKFIKIINEEYYINIGWRTFYDNDNEYCIVLKLYIPCNKPIFKGGEEEEISNIHINNIMFEYYVYKLIGNGPAEFKYSNDYVLFTDITYEDFTIENDIIYDGIETFLQDKFLNCYDVTQTKTFGEIVKDYYTNITLPNKIFTAFKNIIFLNNEYYIINNNNLIKNYYIQFTPYPNDKNDKYFISYEKLDKIINLDGITGGYTEEDYNFSIKDRFYNDELNYINKIKLSSIETYSNVLYHNNKDIDNEIDKTITNLKLTDITNSIWNNNNLVNLKYLPANSIEDNNYGKSTSIQNDSIEDINTNFASDELNQRFSRIILHNDITKLYLNKNKTLIRCSEILDINEVEKINTYTHWEIVTALILTNLSYRFNGNMLLVSYDGTNTEFIDNNDILFYNVPYVTINDYYFNARQFNNKPKIYKTLLNEVDYENKTAEFYTSFVFLPVDIIDLFKNNCLSHDESILSIYINNESSINQTDFIKTIRRSTYIKDESLENGWRTFESEAYQNIQENKGEITRIEGIGDLLLVHTKDSLFQFDKSNLLVTENKTVQLGQQDTFDVGYKEIFTSPFGYGGLQDKEAAIVGEFGYIWYNNDFNKIYQYNAGSLNIISGNIEFLLNKYKPTKCRFVDDKENKRLLIQFQLNNNQILNLTYNYDIKAFISFYIENSENNLINETYNTKTKFYILENNTIFDRFNNSNAKKLSFIINENYTKIKRLNYIKYKLYKGENKDEEFNASSPVEGNISHIINYRTPYSGYKLRVYNDLCDTGELYIDVDYKQPDGDITKPYYDLGNFTFSYLRDKSNDKNQIFGNFFIVEFIFEQNDKDIIEFESLEYGIDYEEN